MLKPCARLVWLLPFAIYSGDALAWGLYTHIYFSQLLIWAIPLADPRFRAAARRLPGLLLAGACLPDTALFSRHVGAAELDHTHQWSAAGGLLAAAHDDVTRALALGFSSHLLTDVVAHNHFVPAHEGLWFDRPVLTHAGSEWAMDAHVAPQLLARPATLMQRHRECLSRYAAEQFGCEFAAARRALSWLGNGERLLRAARLPDACYRGAALLDARLKRRFDYYVSETAARLHQINRVIAGDAPAWDAEIRCARTARERLQFITPRGLAHQPQLPRDFF